MPVEIRAWKFAVPLVGTLFLAAACSSSDPSDPDLGGNPVDIRTFFDTASDVADNDIDETNIVLRSVAAATATPSGAGTTGSVSQDSTGVADPIDIVIAVDNDRTTFDISDGPGEDGILADTTQTPADEQELVTQTPLNPGVPGSSGNDRVVTFVVDTVEVTGTGATATTTTDGTAYMWLRTDKPVNTRGRGSVGGSDDYLAYGFWIFDPAGTPDANNGASIGVFVDGTDAFDQSGLVALTGSAEYLGKANGLYHQQVGGAEDHDAFMADARFTVNFDPTDAADIADIDGQIRGFTFSNAARTTQFEDFVVTLESDTDGTPLLIGAASASLDGGFFAAGSGVRGTLDIDGDNTDNDFAGAWGGKFYGDAESATVPYPETLAGTFGLSETSGNDNWSLLGTFWADYDPNPPAEPAP